MNEKYYKYNIQCSHLKINIFPRNITQGPLILYEARPPGAISENPTTRVSLLKLVHYRLVYLGYLKKKNHDDTSSYF